MKRRTFLQWFGISTVAVTTKSVSGYHDWALAEVGQGKNIDTCISDIAFNDDGDRLIVFGEQTNERYEYHLSTPFDISTAICV